MSELQELRKLASALKKQEVSQLQLSFDPNKPDSRPTEQQLEILQDINTIPHRYALGGNQSGKSQTGGRECAWVFEDNHPYWNRPEEWGDQPLTMIVVARTSAQFEEELWKKKIKPFLKNGEYTEQNAGGVLKKVTHKKNKNTILFFSHHAQEEAREKIQSFTAQWLLQDEKQNKINQI